MQAPPQIDSSKLTAWYDIQAPFYHLWRDSHEAPIVRHVVSLLASGPPDRAFLDVGCGTGLFSIALARALADCRVVGLDLSTGMLRVARRQAARHSLANVAFELGNAEELPFADRTFDAVVAGGLLANLNHRARAVAEMARVVKPGGRIILAEFDRDTTNPATLGLIHALTLGQQIVSFVLPRFRFARRWRAACAFVDFREAQLCIREAQCEVQSVHRAGGHYCLVAAPPLHHSIATSPCPHHS